MHKPLVHCLYIVVKIYKSILKRNIGGFEVKKIVFKFVTASYVLALMAWTISIAMSGQALALAQLTSRSLTLSSSQASAANVTHTFNFSVATTGNIGSMELLYCTTPTGACTAPPGLSVSSVTTGDILTQTINAVAAGFTIGTNTANKIQITRTAASANATDPVVLSFDNITNPSTSTYSPSGNNTFFTRIVTSSDNGYATDVDEGVVASAILPLITVSARVQEILHFCVANTTVNVATVTDPGVDCSAITGTTGSAVDIGVADNTVTGAVSPDTDGNNLNGMFMVRTNAVGGTIVGYRAVQQTGTNYKGALRVAGSTCTATGVGKNDTNNAGARISTDQCFNSSPTKLALTTSIEQFGMTGRFINRVSSDTPTTNLSLSTDYDSTSSVGYAWTEDGSFANVATSVPSTDKVVDDEAIILKFAAVAALTTPTGVYQAQADFIAVPTY